MSSPSNRKQSAPKVPSVPFTSRQSSASNAPKSMRVGPPKFVLKTNTGIHHLEIRKCQNGIQKHRK